MPTCLSEYEGYENSQTHTRRQRACIEFSRFHPDTYPMNITLDRDFARIYCGKYLLCVKDVVFNVRRVHRNGSGSGSAIISDVDVVIEDDNTLQTFTDIEENIRECFENDEGIKHRFPDLEGRMLMNKISKNKMIVTRLRFLDSKPASVSQMLVSLKNEDRVRANIALMGIKHVRGDVFPVWRVISGYIVLEPDGVASSEDEWPGEIVNGEEDDDHEKEHDPNLGHVNTHDPDCVPTDAHEHEDAHDREGIHEHESVPVHESVHDLLDTHEQFHEADDMITGITDVVSPSVEVASEYVESEKSLLSKPSKSKVKLASRDREMIISTLRTELRRDFDNWCSQR